MIRHLVLVRPRPDLASGEWDAALAAIEALRGHISGMLSFTPLSNVSPETPVVHGFVAGFAVDFADVAARDRYLADPAHRAAGERLVASCDGGPAGLLVFDHVI